MTKVKYGIFIMLMLQAFISCQEEYFDDSLETNVKTYVVESFLSSDSDTAVVKISLATSYNQAKLKRDPVLKAKVFISDNEGKKELLVEKKAGVYSSSGKVIKAKIGSKYRLVIITNNKDSLVSDTTTIPYPAEIANINGKIEVHNYLKEDDDGDVNEVGQRGLNIMLSAQPSDNKPFYYMMDIKVIDQRFRNEFNNPDGRYCGTCPVTASYRWFKYNISNEFILKASNDKNVQPLTNFETGFIEELPYNSASADSFKDPMLQMGYIIVAKINSIDAKSYDIFNSIAKQTNPENSLFDPVPVNLESNIHCTNNKAIKVTGYFTGSSVSSSSQFFLYNYNSNNLYQKKIETIDPNTIPQSGIQEDILPSFWINKD